MAIVKEHIGDRKNGRVFNSEKGTPLVVNNVNRHILKPLCRKLKIPVGATHAWRHGRISILQQNNAPGDLIKKWGGHTNLKTSSRYSHFLSDYRKEIVSKLGKVADLSPLRPHNCSRYVVDV
jgi:integrase